MRFNGKRCHCWVCSLICQAAVTASPNPHDALKVSTVNRLTFVVSHVKYFKERRLASHRERSLWHLICCRSDQSFLFWFRVKTRGKKMSPLYENLKCAQCNCTEALLWKSIGEKQQLCNDCFEQTKSNTKQEADCSNRKACGKTEERRSKLRKSTRSTRYNGKNGGGTSNATGTTNSNTTKANTTKSSGRGRRTLFRRPPMKAPSIPASTQNVNCLFYKVSPCSLNLTKSIVHLPDDQKPNIKTHFKRILAGILHSNRWHCFVAQFQLRHILCTNTWLDDWQFLRKISRDNVAVANTK